MIAAIRVRGSTKLRAKIEETLQQLRLDRVNHMVLLDDIATVRGQLKKVESFITYGEIDANTFSKLIKKRGRLIGDKRITLDFLKKSKIKSFKELDSRKKLEKLGVKKVFRLNPPRKGYERNGIKKSFTVGGALGYRGKKINDLINRMV